MSDGPILTTRQRQVLDFVAAYLADEGFLPTTREIASGCGLRSPTSARRAMHSLEELGLVVRDPDHPRLGVVDRPEGGPGDVDIDAELTLCELILVEMEGAVEAARQALAWAPGLEAQGLAHHEALARIQLFRMYSEVRARLVRRAGRRCSVESDGLREHRALVRDRLALLTSWDAYCLSTCLLRTAVKHFVAQPGTSSQIHLRPAYAAEVALLDADRPDLRAVRERLRRGDARLHDLLAEYDAALHQTFATVVPRASALATTPIGDDAVESLVTTFTQLPGG